MILIIDNYDSFVFNLARYFQQLGQLTHVVRNDAISYKDIDELNPSHIVISPGPSTPNEAGMSIDIIRKYHTRIPILGVCLGHQAIGVAMGGKVKRALMPMHGQASVIHHNAAGLFEALPNPLTVGRYHSLVICDKTLPSQLMITATDPLGEIMALKHRHQPVYGVQFHPESILTQQGYGLLKNFLDIT